MSDSPLTDAARAVGTIRTRAATLESMPGTSYSRFCHCAVCAGRKERHDAAMAAALQTQADEEARAAGVESGTEEPKTYYGDYDPKWRPVRVYDPATQTLRESGTEAPHAIDCDLGDDCSCR